MLLSVALRVIAFAELNDGPTFWFHRWDQSDMHFFDLWARQIVQGDVLTDQSLHPRLGWHDRIAQAFIERYPEKARELVGRAVTNPNDPQASSVLWDRWYGGKQFHQGPLYPYLVALTYKAAGSDPRWVFGWQLALGALGNVLIYLIARRHFGPLVGTVAGLLAALCGPLLFYETVLLRSALVTFLGLLLVYLTDLALAEGRFWRWVLTGTALGIAILLKSTFAIFGLGLLVILAYRSRSRPGTLAALLPLAGAILLTLSPLLVRNAVVGAPLGSSSSVGPLAFACSNTADFEPEASFSLSLEYVPAIFEKSDGHFTPTVVETIKTHSNILGWAKLLWGKFVNVWHWYEKPNNTNFYYARLHSTVLRHLPITFLFLAPVSLLGLVLGLRRDPTPLTLYLLALTHLAPLVLFYGLSRFRAPLAAALLPFAALAAVSVVRWWSERKWKQLSLAIFCLLLVTLVTARPLKQPRVRAGFHQVGFTVFYMPLWTYASSHANRTGAVEDWRYAASVARGSLHAEPAAVKRLGPGTAPRDREGAALAVLYAQARERLARALASAGEQQASSRELERARELRAAAARWAGSRK